ncbi:hypothetical protein DL767_002578 [Monosporascus sp. MG133]|nr:hypothetical protein DL767_002578 [Monosporascus sp. MG133]
MLPNTKRGRALASAPATPLSGQISAPLGKYALVSAFVGCSLFGFYVTIGSLPRTGLSVALRNVVSGETEALGGAPQPFRREYTGVGPVDRHLATLVGFFAALVGDAGAGWDATAFIVWGLAQFGAAWGLLMLEGLRHGNRGRPVGGLGGLAVLGFLVQNATYAFTVPLYLALHLLTSPAARLRAGDGDGARRALFVYLWDLALLTSTVTLTYIAPALLMCAPGLFGHTADQHYKWLAIWQAFPLWSVIAQWAAHRACYFLLGSMVPRDDEGRETTPGIAFSVAVSGIYEFALTLCVGTHLPIVALALLPAPLRPVLGSRFASLKPIIDDVTFVRTFVPYPVTAPPTVTPAGAAPGELAAVVTNFLRYDFYVGSLPLLLWAMYLHQTTVKNPSFGGMLRKAGFWFLVGGPIAATAALLWERDEVVKEGDVALKSKTS